jgi:hypothetical protein
MPRPALRPAGQVSDLRRQVPAILAGILAVASCTSASGSSAPSTSERLSHEPELAGSGEVT